MDHSLALYLIELTLKGNIQAPFRTIFLALVNNQFLFESFFFTNQINYPTHHTVFSITDLSQSEFLTLFPLTDNSYASFLNNHSLSDLIKHYYILIILLWVTAKLHFKNNILPKIRVNLNFD